MTEYLLSRIDCGDSHHDHPVTEAGLHRELARFGEAILSILIERLDIMTAAEEQGFTDVQTAVTNVLNVLAGQVRDGLPPEQVASRLEAIATQINDGVTSFENPPSSTDPGSNPTDPGDTGSGSVTDPGTGLAGTDPSAPTDPTQPTAP